MILPVILCGGSGTRLWPLSREHYPKQFLPLISEDSLLQATIARLDALQTAPPMVVCNESHRFLVAEQLRQADIEPGPIVLEPAGRNTAPAAAVAALLGRAGDEDPVLLVLPADHAVRDVDTFVAAMRVGLAAAAEGKLVTFGVVPDCPETGYGYIRAGSTPAGDDAGPRPVAAFVEKPDESTARGFLADGGYYWNSGMFMFRASAYLAALAQFAPDIHASCSAAVEGAARDMDFTRLPGDAFGACRADSIDYAVMERTTGAVVVPLDAGWSDVGSWDSLHAAVDPDADGNVRRGDVVMEDTHDSLVYAGSRLVVTVGLADHVVVETPDAVLVAPRSASQAVKRAVERLREAGRPETSLHREVFRPWGSYDSVDNGERFQVKRLVVNPGAVLSLQMHHHRAEHWIVVSGTARITRGDEEFLLGENQSTYIPLGVRHRIENPGVIPLNIIEVQSGSYLGEDDIVRFEDNYGREGTNT